MSLLNRQPARIGRAERKQRDDRVFLVATEDTHAPRQYFDNLKGSMPRVLVKVIPTPEGSGHSSPQHVVERLRNSFMEARRSGHVQEGDEFWVLLDTDHHTRGTHLANTCQAMQVARSAGFEIAFSNPSFELWLLLHHSEVGKSEAFPDAQSVVARLQAVLGGYRKNEFQPETFRPTMVPLAIKRAQALEDEPDNPTGDWPERVGTRMYRLMKALGFSSED